MESVRDAMGISGESLSVYISRESLAVALDSFWTRDYLEGPIDCLESAWDYVEKLWRSEDIHGERFALNTTVIL